MAALHRTGAGCQAEDARPAADHGEIRCVRRVSPQCCRCGKNIPRTHDVYELDAEWQRRFPDMVRTLACHACALRTYWSCTDHNDSYVDGHLPAATSVRCFDAWNHVSWHGSPRDMVFSSPRSGLLQGAEAYLRDAVTRKGTHPQTAAKLRTAIQDWDEEHGTTGVPQPTV